MIHKLKDRDVWPLLLLIFFIILSLWFKLSNLAVGAPFVTIDDHTMYEGGFLVWFGQAPPQRMYLESWISGITSLATYVVGQLNSGQPMGINLIADAYSDFHSFPERYVIAYRYVALAMDMLTAGFIFLMARTVLSSEPRHNAMAVLATGFYLLSYNTLWCDVVARPDTLAALFSVIGLFFYYKSDFSQRSLYFFLSALCFGVATGAKLHAAFFVVFIILDCLRVLGLRAASVRIIPFGIISVLAFFIAAGSPIFDPLLYLKLRLLNVHDDVSPWIQWGDQFLVILRGTGWLVIPLLIAAAAIAWRRREWRRNQRVASVIFLSLCWVVLFCSIRQLRAYWMLSALPLFYIAAVYAIANIQRRAVAAVVASMIVVVMGWQCYEQAQSFRHTPYSQLQSWVRSNVQRQESIFILGYEALGLPKSSEVITHRRLGLERKIAASFAEGDSFTVRHVKLWEERSKLMLLSMLEYRSPAGYSYYGYHSTPLDMYQDIIEFSAMDYVLLQEGFSLEQEPNIAQALQLEFTEVAQVVGPGGGGRGLNYRIYQRDVNDAH